MPTHWKRFRPGVLGFLVGLTGGQMAGYMHPDGSMNYIAVAFVAIMTAFALCVKDRDVTGGRIPD